MTTPEMTSTQGTTFAAAYLVEVAASLPAGKTYAAEDVRELLVQLADDLVPPVLDDQQMWRHQPMPSGELARSLGHHFQLVEEVHSDYERCVLVAQFFGTAANRLDAGGRHQRAEVLREFGHAVGQAGRAL